MVCWLYYAVPSLYYEVLSLYDGYISCYFFFVVFLIIYKYINLNYGGLSCFLLYYTHNYDKINQIFIYLFNINNKVYSILKNYNSIPKPHYFNLSPLICTFSSVTALILLSNATLATDVDLARIAAENLNDLAALKLNQEKYEYLAACYKQTCIEANHALTPYSFTHRSWPSYHWVYWEATDFYSSPTLNNTEIKIKEIRKSIMDYHNAGITNEDSYKRDLVGQPYLLKTRAGDFSHAWIRPKRQWNSDLRFRFPEY